MELWPWLDPTKAFTVQILWVELREYHHGSNNVARSYVVLHRLNRMIILENDFHGTTIMTQSCQSHRNSDIMAELIKDCHGSTTAVRSCGSHYGYDIIVRAKRGAWWFGYHESISSKCIMALTPWWDETQGTTISSLWARLTVTTIVHNFCFSLLT